jgi:hypothetical protein
LEEQWFDLYRHSSSQHDAPTEVPQLWHERYHEVIKLQHGELPLNGGKQGVRACAYGGVDLKLNPGGLYEFPSAKPEPVSNEIANYGQRAIYPNVLDRALNLETGGTVRQYAADSAPVGAPRKRQLNWRSRRGGGMRLTTPQMPKRLGLGFEPQQLTRMLPQVLPPHPLSAAPLPPSLGLAPLAPLSVAGTVQAKGVDLNLDKFCLDNSNIVAEETALFDWGSCLLPSKDNSASIVDAFWASVDGKSVSPFEDEGNRLLKSRFNPHVSDRREEGDLFIPPSTKFSNVQSLIDRVADEDTFRQHRMEHFCSPQFERSTPSFLFPRSWTCSVEVTDEQDRGGSRHASMSAVIDHKLTVAVVKSLVPKFDKYTEDGTRFRIYNVGSLEVRTVQEHDVAEVIGAVFSKSATKQPTLETDQSLIMHGRSKVSKVSLYVEKCEPSFGYFVVLETLEGNLVVADLPKFGSARWEWNPIDLDCRRSLAKIVNSVECTAVQDMLTISDIQNSCSTYENLHGSSSHSDRKNFAVGVCTSATNAFKEV